MLRLLLIALALLGLGLGCAAEGFRPQTPELYYPSITDVPPEFYDGDPILRYWFTAPYWDPSVGP